MNSAHSHEKVSSSRIEDTDPPEHIQQQEIVKLNVKKGGKTKSLYKKKVDKSKIGTSIYLSAAIMQACLHKNQVAETFAQKTVAPNKKMEQPKVHSNMKQQTPHLFVNKQIDQKCIDQILSFPNKAKKQKQHHQQNVSKLEQKLHRKKDQKAAVNLFLCASQAEKAAILFKSEENDMPTIQEQRRSVSVMKLNNRCFFPNSRYKNRQLPQDALYRHKKVKNRSYTLNSKMKKFQSADKKDCFNNWGDLKIRHNKHLNKQNQLRFNKHYKNPYEQKFVEDLKHFKPETGKKEKPQKSKLLPDQITSVNDLRVDPVEMYQIKNNIACDQFKRNLYENEPEFNNYSSHYFISHGDLFLKEEGYRKPDEIKFEASFRSFASSVEGSNIQLAYNGDEYLSKYPRNRTSGLSIHPTPSLANLDEGFEVNKRAMEAENTSHENRLDTQISQQMRKSDNDDSNKNSGLSANDSVKGTVFCRQIKQSEKPLNLYGSPNELSLADIQRSILAKEKNFLVNLKAKQFYVILWDQKCLSHKADADRNSCQILRGCRRNSYLALCTALQLIKEQGRSFNACSIPMSFENIISEAERKQQIRKQTMTLKFDLALNHDTSGQNQGFNNVYLHFELELRRRNSAGGSKIDCYREKLFVACLSSNFEDFMKYLRKVAEVFVLREAVNGKKLKLRITENYETNQSKYIKKDEVCEYSKDSDKKSKQKKVTIQNYQMARDSTFKTTKHRKRQSQVQRRQKQNQEYWESKREKYLESNQNQKNFDNFTHIFNLAQYGSALNTTEAKAKMYNSLDNKTSLKKVKSQKIISQTLRSNKKIDSEGVKSLSYKGFISIEKKYFLVYSKMSLPLDNKLKYFSFLTQINHELLNQTGNMILSEGNRINLSKRNGSFAQIVEQKQMNQLMFSDESCLAEKYVKSKVQRQKYYYSFITQLSKVFIGGNIFGLSSQLTPSMVTQIDQNRDSNIASNQKMMEKQQLNPARIRIIQCEESIIKKNEDEPGVGERKRNMKKKHCKVLSNANQETNALYLKHLQQLGSHSKLTLAYSQQMDKNDAGVSVQNSRKQACSNKRTKQRVQGVYGKKFGQAEAAKQLHARNCNNFTFKFQIMNSRNTLLTYKQNEKISLKVHGTFYIECVINRSNLSRLEKDLIVFKGNQNVHVKFKIRSAHSSRIYILNSSVRSILSTIHSHAKNKQYKNLIPSSRIIQSHSQNKITLKQFEEFASKFQKYRTFISTDFKTCPPIYEVVYRKVKKLQTELYVIITIIHSGAMRCARVKVYASWLQKTFFFKVSFERIEQKMHHKYEQRTARYWDQIGEYYAKILKNSHFKQNVDTVTLRLKEKNMRLYHTILRKSVQGSTNHEQRLRNLPGGRSIKLKNKSKGTNHSMEESKCFAQSETILYEQVAHERVKGLNNQQYEIELYCNFRKQSSAQQKNEQQKYSCASERAITIQISQRGKFGKLLFTWSAHQTIGEVSGQQMRASTPGLLNTNIIFSLIQQSLEIAPNKIYKQLVQKITNCIRGEQRGKQASIIKRIKELFQNRCPPLNQPHCNIQFRKRIHGEWFCVGDLGDTNPNKKIFISNREGQEQQMSLPIMGFQNCVPFSNYNRRLIARVYKTVSKVKHV